MQTSLQTKFFLSQLSRGAPVSVRNLVRQATVHLAGEDETTEHRTELWVTVILLTLVFGLTSVGVILIVIVIVMACCSNIQ